MFGYNEGDARVVLFEVRRVKRNVPPPQAGEFAFRIEDTGAARRFS